MKRILVFLALALALLTVNAHQIRTPLGISETNIPINGVTGKALLQQDMIDNANTNQTFRRPGQVFGRNALVQNVRCDLWEGPTCSYVFPAAPIQMKVASTSASDAAAGTGAQSVHIYYLDTNYAEQQEIVILNGLTAVSTVATNILRINNFHVDAAGSSGVAAGTISLTNVAATITYSIISAGNTASRQAIYTVPAGVNGYISHWQASSGTVTGTHFTVIGIYTTAQGGSSHPGIFIVVDEMGTLNNGISINLPIPIRIPAQTDVKMSAISDAANANAVALGAIMGWFE